LERGAAAAIDGKKKRFEDKLNSYKDSRFQPYVLAGGGNGDNASSKTENGGGGGILANLNNFNNNVSNNINNSFINLTNAKKAAQNPPNYLIWDNNVSFFFYAIFFKSIGFFVKAYHFFVVRL
jgi:hypothetical protein